MGTARKHPSREHHYHDGIFRVDTTISPSLCFIDFSFVSSNEVLLEHFRRLDEPRSYYRRLTCYR